MAYFRQELFHFRSLINFRHKQFQNLFRFCDYLLKSGLGANYERNWFLPIFGHSAYKLSKIIFPKFAPTLIINL